MINLLEFSKGSGCGCKLPPAALNEVLQSFRKHSNQNLLSGNAHNEDAAVWLLDDGQLLISTADFFTPVVSDAFDFGRIASANAISDVYAMGAKPVFALALMGWPLSKIPLSEAQRVMQGATEICLEAGVLIAGGHTIESEEPIFGLAVNGFTPRNNLKTNAGALAGDAIYLSKPLGSGILAAAMRRGLIREAEMTEMMRNMTQLNALGQALGALPGVHALTDVTGFGLLGHLSEMAAGSGLCAEIQLGKIPLMTGVKEYAHQFVYPNLTTSNYQSVQPYCEGLNGMEFLWLCDPQTNGGLLVSLAPDAEEEFLRLAAEQHPQRPEPVLIGHFSERHDSVHIKIV
jgi:selenide,water dikinase